MAEQAKPEENFRHIVRVVNTDLEGKKPIGMALLKIKGIGFMFSNAVCKLTNIDATKTTGNLNDAEVAKLEECIRNPHKFHIPSWMMNRRKDLEAGSDKHLLTSDITFNVDNDIKLLKKIRAYRGVRHMLGQPVRGQKTKSNSRKNKGKVTGVKKVKVAPAAGDKKKD